MRRLAMVFVLLGLLAGCAPPIGGGSSAPTSGAPLPAPGRAPSQSPSQPSGGSAADLDQDTRTAVQITDAFWARHWSEFFTGSYSPPRVVGAYNPSSGRPTCGGEPPLPDNAFYCATGEDFLAWDSALLAKGVQYGDAWVYLVIAHEWGHAIQARLDLTLQSQSAELQADCFAGATIYGAAADGTLALEPGDEKEITSGLTELADETAWTAEGDHGDTFQRINAFGEGRSGGVQACLPTSS